jgi:hypothetical protein
LKRPVECGSLRTGVGHDDLTARLLLLVGVADRGDALRIGGERRDAGALDL